MAPAQFPWHGSSSFSQYLEDIVAHSAGHANNGQDITFRVIRQAQGARRAGDDRDADCAVLLINYSRPCHILPTGQNVFQFTSTTTWTAPVTLKYVGSDSQACRKGLAWAHSTAPPAPSAASSSSSSSKAPLWQSSAGRDLQGMHCAATIRHGPMTHSAGPRFFFSCDCDFFSFFFLVCVMCQWC